MKIVIYGLTITSSWGNGHATTFRSLSKALHARGHQVRFIEKDVEWYRNNRDLASPPFCSVRLYTDWQTEEQSLVSEAADADAVIVGSYFPDAIIATQALLAANVQPLFFYDIDTPITMSALRNQGRCEYLTAALIPHYTAYLSFTGGPALRELETTFGARQALPFYCSVDPDVYQPTAIRNEYRCDLSYLGTYAPDRQLKLMSLLNAAAQQTPASSYLVAGALYPADTAFAPNVRHLTHVAPPDHPAFYSSSRFTLNLTRADMVAAGWSPSVRIFEASACGSAIISDSWQGLADFLTPGQEILLPASGDEVAAILTGMSEAERQSIGARARQRILAEHTSTQRAQQLEQIVSSASTAPEHSATAPQTTPQASLAVPV